jgi:hypothetical protein
MSEADKKALQDAREALERLPVHLREATEADATLFNIRTVLAEQKREVQR